MLKLMKLKIGASTVILSSGLLFGCAAPNLDDDDEQEPDLTEEPSEQQDYNDNGSNINEDPVKNENIRDQNQNGQDKNNQDNNNKKGLEDILRPGHQ